MKKKEKGKEGKGKRGKTKKERPGREMRRTEKRRYPVAKRNEDGHPDGRMPLGGDRRPLGDQRPRRLGRGSVQRKAESATATLNFWFDRAMRVRLFCESSATQPPRRNPAGDAASRTNTMVIVLTEERRGGDEGVNTCRARR